jgi:excisionase family DNA binding protein
VNKLLLTPEEAAHALSVGRSKLYELLATGALRSVRIGASRRITVDAIADYVTGLGGIDDLPGTDDPDDPAGTGTAA